MYLRKVLRRESWKKLITGAVNFRMIGRVLFGHFRPKREAAGSRNPQESARDREIVRDLGRYRGRLLMLFGGADPEAVDARGIFGDFFAGEGVRAEFDEIPGANHNFYSLQWKDAAIDRSAQWLLDVLGMPVDERT